MTSEPIPRPAWMYRQSAALPYRWRDGALEVLLITSRKRRRWLAPKGIVEPGLSAAASAAKEALEEAGVVGSIAPDSLGSYQRAKWGGICDIAVYPLLVSHELETWEESAIRQRRWFSIAEALEAIEDAGLVDLIARLPDAIDHTDERTSGTFHRAVNSGNADGRDEAGTPP